MIYACRVSATLAAFFLAAVEAVLRKVNSASRVVGLAEGPVVAKVTVSHGGPNEASGDPDTAPQAGRVSLALRATVRLGGILSRLNLRAAP